MLCQYRDMFGRPGEGVHSVRIFGLAAVDVALTLVAAYGLSRLLNASLWKVVVALFVLGIVAHAVFCVDTALNRALGRLFG